MIYYSLPFILLLPCICQNKLNYSRYILFIVYVVMPIIFCFGYMVGSDWRSYELDYDLMDTSSFSYNVFRGEPGYYFLAFLVKKIGIGFWEFSILIKLVGYYSFIYIYRKYSTNYVGLLYAIPAFMLYSMVNFPARSYLAFTVFMFNIPNIINRKFVRFVALWILASTFHLSALIVFPVYFFTSFNTKHYLIVSIVLAVAAMVYIGFVGKDVFSVFSNLDYLDINERLDPYSNEQNIRSTFSIGLLVKIGLLLYLILKFPINNKSGLLWYLILKFPINNKSFNNDYTTAMINLSITYVLFSAIAAVIPIFSRAADMISLPFFIILGMSAVKKTSISFNIVILIVSVLLTIRIITSTYLFVPYSNYLEYIASPKPSYEYRDNYNYNNSPYK